MPVTSETYIDSIGTLDDLKEMQLYIVSSNTFQSQLLKTCLDSELGLLSFYRKDLPLQDFIDNPNTHQCIYLLDCLNSDMSDIEKILEIDAAKVPDYIIIALYNIGANCDLAPIVKRYKIRGIFFREDSQAMFIKGMKLILNGDLWLSRKLLSQCILNPTKDIKKPSSQPLPQLSRREVEILRHVGHGQSNQEIADVFNISLHTVKTHIYNIYKKIDASNRLQATMWANNFLEEV